MAVVVIFLALHLMALLHTQFHTIPLAHLQQQVQAHQALGVLALQVMQEQSPMGFIRLVAIQILHG